MCSRVSNAVKTDLGEAGFITNEYKWTWAWDMGQCSRNR